MVYGTSIAQGGCASRPGMAWPTILARRIDRPAINLGFSGNGKLDPEMGPLLAELDPVVYVVDCLHNCGSLGRSEIEQRLSGLVDAIRARRTAPIVFVGKSAIDNLVAVDERSHWQETAMERLRARGTRDLFVVPGKALNGTDGDATVDGVHPNDLGMLRHAEALEPLVRRLAEGGR
ncbi:MAG: SGNH/GDSL hydrolase family protein [Armatimonadaceae bacterium]